MLKKNMGGGRHAHMHAQIENLKEREKEVRLEQEMHC
jgi:hypothetical protein